MTIVQVIPGRERNLGGFVVRRVLPYPERRMVGPFIFFDHLGPAQFAPGAGIDVRPHPHIGLATVTFLFSGALAHRDSLGNFVEIEPGDVNWMTAGHGITHSERTPEAVRAAGPQIHGIQSWVALPDGFEDVAPSFAHHSAAVLPRKEIAGVVVTLIAGSGFGMTSAVETLWPTIYAQLQMPAASALELAADAHAERAVYVVHGSVDIGGATLDQGCMGLLASDATVVRAMSAARVMLLGGAPFPSPRYLEWNFVASSRERIESAKERWRRQEFPTVRGETEFIPLPQ